MNHVREFNPQRASFWNRFQPLLQKELRETLRDRRTIATLFLMPLLVYPILSLLLQNFLPSTLAKNETIHFRIVVASSEGFEPLMQRIGLADSSLKAEANLPKLREAEEKFQNLLDADDASLPETLNDSESASPTAESPNASISRQVAGETELDPSLGAKHLEPEELDIREHSWSIYDGGLNLEDVVAAGEIDLAIRFVDLDVTEDTRRRASLPGKGIELVYNRDNEYSRRAAEYVALRIERSNLLESQVTLQQLRVPLNLAMARWTKPVSSTQASSTTTLATFIPLILIMMTITGAVYPAIDLTAGERERGTLESLVAAPVSRMGVLSAKYIAVWVVAMLTATLNIVSMLATMWVFQLDKVLLSNGITVTLVVQIFLLLGLYAIFFSAVLLVLTSIARSFKEAQAYLIPLMMFSLAPGILAMMPELGSAIWLSLVPMVNLVLLARDVMQESVQPLFATLAIVTSLLYSLAALAMAANFFGSDAVLYGSQGSWRELLRSQKHKNVPSPAFAFMVLALLFPSQFLLLGVMGRWREAWSPIQTVAAIAIGTACLFLLMPAALVAMRRYQFRETFALRWPKLSHLAGGVVLGIGAWPFVGLALWGLGQAVQWATGDVGQSDWMQRVTRMAVTQVAGWSEIPTPILIFTLAVVPAVCEEFFFRGLLLQSLAKRTTFWRAIIASGLAFGLFHFIVESSVAPLRFFVTSIMGFLLAWVCLKSKSLMPGILLHSINNGILTSLALLREQLSERPDIQSPELWKVAALLGIALLLIGAGYWLLRKGTNIVPQVAVAFLLAIGTICSLENVAHGQRFRIQQNLSRNNPSEQPRNPGQTAAQARLASAEVNQEDLPAVAEGWTIQRYADDRLAHDIHSMTVAPDGTVYVAGPGYVAELIDSDNDGIADQSRRLPFSPKQGAQGILAEDDWIWVAVDQAIWQVNRSNAVARQFLRLPKTGGEHDFHAIRRGHDGYLYFVAGNYAGINQSFTTNPAPIAGPLHGVVGRISSDGQVRQVLVDGMRNSYDFAFDLDHSILVYDSDDERDSGLPWYRPTTLFDAKAGQNIGWISRCYKQPDGVIGSATIRAKTGRGSPTGVATLHRNDWGADWLGAVAFADWTFGRIYLQRSPATIEPTSKPTSDGPPLLLVSSRSGVAFAPTDLEFDAKGNLYVSVGGRDTAGAVYVIRRAEGNTEAAAETTLSFLHELASRTSQRIAEEDLQRLISICDDQQQTEVHRSIAQQLLRRTVRAYALWPEVNSEQVAGIKGLLSEPNHGFDEDLAADFAIWLAMNPPADKVSLAIGKDASVARQVEMMACMSPRQLFSIVSGNQLSVADRKLALSALALQRGDANLIDNSTELLADDLQLSSAGEDMRLGFSDWLVVMQWVLGNPVANDGNTSPWDFMKRSHQIPEDRMVASDLNQKFAYAAAGIPKDKPFLNYLKLGLLVGIEESIMLEKWQDWYSQIENQLGPVEKIDAFVVLAAIKVDHPTDVQNAVCQFLLNIDQELAQADISIDNNWSERFDALGRLLLADQNTAKMFRDSDLWSRPQQIHALKLLNALDQVLPLQKMAKVWTEWSAQQLPPEFLNNLSSATQQWRVTSKQLDGERLAAVQDLSLQVQTFQQRVEQERAAYLAALKKQLASSASDAVAEKVTPQELVDRVDWTTGNHSRGEQLYQVLNCQRCHAKAGRLGPSLAGVTRRFAKRDLVEAIVDPSRNVNDRYQSLLVQTVDGRVISGVPVYNSTDAMILEDADGKTWQLPRADIEDSRVSDQSLMPEGLMDSVSDQDWADLLSYLEKL